MGVMGGRRRGQPQLGNRLGESLGVTLVDALNEVPSATVHLTEERGRRGLLDASAGPLAAQRKPSPCAVGRRGMLAWRGFVPLFFLRRRIRNTVQYKLH